MNFYIKFLIYIKIELSFEMEKHPILIQYFNITLKKIFDYEEIYSIGQNFDNIVIMPLIYYTNSLITACRSNSALWEEIHKKLVLYFTSRGILDRSDVEVFLLTRVEGIGVNLNPNKNCYISKLPNEMLDEISKHLEINDALSLYQTSKDSSKLLDNKWWNLQFKNRYMPIMKSDKLTREYDYKVLVNQIRTSIPKNFGNLLGCNLILYDIAINKKIQKKELLRFLIFENCITDISGPEIYRIIQADYYDLYEYILNNYFDISGYDPDHILSTSKYLLPVLLSHDDYIKYIKLLLEKINIESLIVLLDKLVLQNITENTFKLICDKINPYSLISKIEYLNFENQNVLYELCKDILTAFDLNAIFIKLCLAVTINKKLIYNICHHPLMEQYYNK